MQRLYLRISHNPDRCAVLQDAGQSNHRFAVSEGRHKPGIAHSELNLTVHNPCYRIFLAARAILMQGDIQARLRVIAFFQSRIIPGKLELMLPAQLQGNRFQREYRQNEDQQKQPGDSFHRGDLVWLTNSSEFS